MTREVKKYGRGQHATPGGPGYTEMLLTKGPARAQEVAIRTSTIPQSWDRSHAGAIRNHEIFRAYDGDTYLLAGIQMWAPDALKLS